MNTKSIVGVVLVLLVVLIGFLWLKPFADDTGDNGAAVGTVPATGGGVELLADHSYANGTHVLEGQMDVPTPCHEIKHEIVQSAANPKEVTINFRTESTADICTQVIATKLWRVEFAAPEDAIIQATLNTEPVVLKYGSVEGAAVDKL